MNEAHTVGAMELLQETKVESANRAFECFLCGHLWTVTTTVTHGNADPNASAEMCMPCWEIVRKAMEGDDQAVAQFQSMMTPEKRRRAGIDAQPNT